MRCGGGFGIECGGGMAVGVKGYTWMKCKNFAVTKKIINFCGFYE